MLHFNKEATINGNLLFFKENNNPSFKPLQITPKVIKQQAIYKAQRLIMLDNYRKYVEAYNKNLNHLNKEVKRYNSKVYAFVAQNSLEPEAVMETEEFKNLVGKCSIFEYNQAVKIFNQKKGKLLVEQVEHKAVKKSLEHTFSAILFKYAMQIDEKNNILINVGATTTRSIQKVKVNHYELANTVIDGVNILPYSKRTIHNHVNRLTDAGILFGYEFHGNNKPVSYFVNNQILTLFCQETRKTLNAQNQLFNFSFVKNLHHNEIDTLPFLNKYKINDVVNNQHQHKGDLPANQSLKFSNENNFYKNTKTVKNFKEQLNNHFKKNAPKASENAPKAHQAQKFSNLSDFLRSKIIDTTNFCEELSAGSFNNYRFGNRKHLENEIIYGNMDRHELRELLIQTVLKISAPIWTNHKNVTVATWRAAYNVFNDTQFLNPNGTIPGKNVLMYKFDNLVWRLKYAKAYFKKHTEFKALYPSQYFDPTRKTAKSGGFAYTIEALKSRENYKQEKQKRQELRNRKSAKRNRNYNAIELIEKKINALKNGKISIVELHDYVKNNASIPANVAENLPNYIHRIYKA